MGSGKSLDPALVDSGSRGDPQEPPERGPEPENDRWREARAKPRRSSGALLSLSAQQGEDLRGSHQAKSLEAPHPDSALPLCPSPREIPQGLGNPSMVPQPNKESPLEVLPAV